VQDDIAMQAEFDAAVDSLTGASQETRRKGRVISIFAPTTGSGATTLAVNLAGALAATYPQGVVLAEMGRNVSDIPIRLNFTAEIGTNDICRRWEQLDSTSLGAGLTLRETGLRVLAHKSEESHFDDDPLLPSAVRRVGVLMRSNYPFAIWKLDNTVDEECLEALKLSDEILLVIRPDVLCVRRAQSAKNLAEAHGVDPAKFKLVVNRWGQPGQLTRRQIERSLAQPISFIIPDEPKVANRALNRGQFFHEVSRSASATRRIAKIAKKLDQ
jgi:pilus assembly protein CpaE